MFQVLAVKVKTTNTTMTHTENEDKKKLEYRAFRQNSKPV
jgi:hypothetical protein